jgi:large subunit ribosomal protein L23
MTDTLLIKKPWISEKATDLGKIGKYVFIVKSSATKPEVRKVVKEIYKVDAITVNIVNKPSKMKRFKNMYGRQGGYKKAVVTLKAGQKIDLA